MVSLRTLATLALLNFHEVMTDKKNILDNIIGFFSPSLGVKRQMWRRSYEAASHSGRNSSMMHAGNNGPNTEIGNALETLRNRSRMFVRNNGWAARAITAIVNNTVGEGIRPAPTGNLSNVKNIKKVWDDWAGSTECDYYGKSTFYGLQNIIMREIAEAGDCIILRRRVNAPIPIKLQVLEPDQLDITKNSINEMGFARLGVQFNKLGMKIGYWVFPYHPNDYNGMDISLQSVFISNDDVLHPFEILRAGQVRGVPQGTAAFMKLSDFSDYEDAQLILQKAASCSVAFVRGSIPQTGDDDNNERVEHLTPGMVKYLGENEEVTFNNPSSPGGYGEYSKKILQGIAAAYSITYEMLTMDYSNVNFTSGRMAKIDVSSHFRDLQYNMLVPQLCVPVWNWFMNAAVISGLIKKPISCSAEDWTAPRVQQLDPVKETNARVLQIQSGLSTLSECIREDGRDPDEFFDEYAQDMERLKKLGINLSSVQPVQSIEINNNGKS